ncbi:helix-turn-helix transcriptional regulator [Pseudodonghicola flavimaris]|uniref:Helix-turn-helix transcriptional regulator n=1 Tax=Pseudodonghicola flavimaris TaxID=3050036 RepID=A0ABT7F1W9_9RHOB|nr:helix-turn-helix transcriptional regulator [Pseudodonghicola flavimaris]MDK3018570.1 helix-turn-helix transcriptional regulator [Pseudodonghicola flavimaris]
MGRTASDPEQEPEPPTDAALPLLWAEAAGSLLRTVGTPAFPTALRSALGLSCAFSSLVVTRYQSVGPPGSLYHDLNDVLAAITVQFYAAGPYILDPIYIAAVRDRCPPGAYRLSDVAPAGFLRSEYYRTFFRKLRISDEMCLLIPDGPDAWISVSLARALRDPRFSPTDRNRLNAAAPLISAAVIRHWGSDHDETEADSAVEDRLHLFAAEHLSPREAEVVELILQGHSTPSIAAYLGLAEGTVKVHRHHAYAKLGIASQAELFSLATKYLMAPQS